MELEWDPEKDRLNREWHGISFEEAAELVARDDYLEIYDQGHSGDEDRFIAIGAIRRGVVVVIFTERQDDVIRLISARRATRREAELYREHKRDSQ